MKEKDKKVISKDGIEFTISSRVKDCSNDPFFVKKAEKADKFLKKAGFPNIPPLKK